MSSSNKYIIFLTISKRNNNKIKDYFNFFTINCKNRKFLNETKYYHVIKSYMTKQQYLKLFNNSSNIKEFDETLKTGFLKYLNYDITYLMDINKIFENTDKINIIYINTRYFYKPIINKQQEDNSFYDLNKRIKKKKQKYQQIWLDSEKVVLPKGQLYIWGSLSDRISEIVYQKELKKCEGILIYDYRTPEQIKKEDLEQKNKEIALRFHNSYDVEFPCLNKTDNNKEENKVEVVKKTIKIKTETSDNKLLVSSPITLKNKFSGLYKY